MNDEDRATVRRKRPETGHARATIYTGEGFAGSRPEGGRRRVSTGHEETHENVRRIGSLVQSEAEPDEDMPADGGRAAQAGAYGRNAGADAPAVNGDRAAHENLRSRNTGAYIPAGNSSGAASESPRSRNTNAGAAALNESKEKRDAKRTAEKARQGSGITNVENALRRRRVKRIHRVLWVLGGAVAAAYIAVAVYFCFHFYEGTEIYGIDCSQMTLDEAKQEVIGRLGEYTLQIEERGDKTETLTADQVALEFVDNNSIDRVLKAQRPYVWPVMIFMKRSGLASVSFSYDKEKALAMLDALDCMNLLFVTAPKDAYIGVTDGGFEVVEEVMGTTLDRGRTQEAVVRALDRGASSVSLDEEGCYIDPEIYQDDEKLQSDAAAMSELARAKITYDFGDRSEVIDASVIQDWIVTAADGSFVIDDMCVTDYVTSLAEKYDTFGLTREFYTSLGTVETLTGGDYGWCIDQGATVAALMRALESGYQGTMEPEYVYTGMSRDTNDIGYTYVEICISQQRMWCYKDGTCIVDTPVVTGNPNKGNATPSGGVWAIDAKKRNAVLTGEGYTAPVDYWMPFNGDVGIHDLKSRAYFGSTIYLTNGSHGCVNTPYDAVQLIYDTVSIGTPVIVYE